MMTGPGTNTYLVGRRDPILIDTGAGVADYPPLFARYLAERGWTQPSRVLLTHRHRDHLGGVPQLRERYRGLHVAKMIYKDADLPRRTSRTCADGAADRGRRRHADRRPHARPRLRSPLLLPGGGEGALHRRRVLGGSTTVIPAEDGDLLDYMNSLQAAAGPGRAAHLSRARARSSRTRRPRSRSTSSIAWMRERQILQALGDGLAHHPRDGRAHLRRRAEERSTPWPRSRLPRT